MVCLVAWPLSMYREAVKVWWQVQSINYVCEGSSLYGLVFCNLKQML
jgi:hypothetical protein